jgi:hypothetical protein
MTKRPLKVQALSEASSTAVIVYTGALLIGAVLICTRSASPAEASGFVTPFLVAYERGAGRRQEN